LKRSNSLRAKNSGDTGVRCIDKTHGLHVVSTATHRLFSHSPKRGIEGFAVAQVLPTYQGMLAHDFWGPDDTLECDHRKQGINLINSIKAAFTGDSVKKNT